MQDAKRQLFKEKDDVYRLPLNINGQNIIDSFKQKYEEITQIVKSDIRPVTLQQKKGKGV